MSLFITQASLWLTETNCYLVSAEQGRTGVLVDAPPDADSILHLAEHTGIRLEAVLLTHGHVDHIGGAGRLARELGIPCFLHPEDEWLANDLRDQLVMLLGTTVPGDYERPAQLQPLADEQVLTLAGIPFRVLHTPGHTPGHCCFWVEDEGALFTGDHLFAGSVGRTDLPGGDEAALMQSMAQRVMTLPPQTQVLPGHGPATTLAQELATNPFLQA